jgi:ribonuclease D
MATPEELEEAQTDLRQETIVGLDTEARPAFRKGESHLPGLVPAATARAVWLFQLRRTEGHPVLAKLLADSRIIKAGISLKDNLRAEAGVSLRREEHARPRNRRALARPRPDRRSQPRRHAPGFSRPKGTKTSNWAVRELSPVQITYAATDAWACRELYLKFHSLGLLA